MQEPVSLHRCPAANGEPAEPEGVQLRGERPRAAINRQSLSTARSPTERLVRTRPNTLARAATCRHTRIGPDPNNLDQRSPDDRRSPEHDLDHATPDRDARMQCLAKADTQTRPMVKAEGATDMQRRSTIATRHWSTVPLRRRGAICGRSGGGLTPQSDGCHRPNVIQSSGLKTAAQVVRVGRCRPGSVE